MTVSNPPKLWTSEDLLAFPDDGVERYIWNGQLYEVPGEVGEDGVTRRNYSHSRTMGRVSYVLSQWLTAHPEVGGDLLIGDAGFRLRATPLTTIGADVAYISEALRAATPPGAALIDGAPVLAVEILSPTDTQRGVTQKIGIYLDNGVQLVWILDPDHRTVRVHRAGQPAQSLDLSRRVENLRELPGFSCAVADLF
jgi:Uma2 family endonuclease